MAPPADYHMHTPLCHHAVGVPVEYAAEAVRIGLNEIGFSDHSPMPRDDFDDWRMRLDDLDEYVRMIGEARKAYPDLTIKLALEVDYIPGHESWIQELAARHAWDYFIGSVHYVSDSWDLDNPKKLSQWRERDPIDVWTAYFERLTQAAQSGLFQIIGHADLAKKFCFYPSADCTDLFTSFLTAARKTGTAIELNTAGLRKDCKEIYPSRRILELAYERGVPITFGSDAHTPGEVGMNFADAVELARAVGYTHRCTFTHWKRTDVLI
jgi:histidinol-phosphatase (PHP family)